MKKAKILIPSISILCFSAIACVTGSVAWFSSVSNASVATSEFEVKALTGAMAMEVYHGVGTKATLADASDDQKIFKSGTSTIIGYKGSDSIVVKPDTYGESPNEKTNVLTHGSFDAGNQKVYTMKAFSSLTSPEYEQIGKDKAITKDNESSFYASGTQGYYHIFSFDLKFTYDFGESTTGKYNLFFDVETSKFGRKTAAPESGSDIAKGFRIGFYNTSSKDWVVWSDLQSKEWGDSTPKTKSHYVSEVDSKLKTVDYNPAADGNLIYSDDTITKVTTSTGSAARKDCLGTFDNEATTKVKAIEIKVVAWYEGEDPNVNSDATLNAVKASMSFYLKGYEA